MKIIFLTFIFITSLFGVNLNWEHNYYKALYDAKQQGKDVYLFIGADDCRFCDRYNDLALSKKFVMDKLKEYYIPLYMSRDQHKIPNKFKVEGVPRHYFLTSDGKIIHADQGSREPDGLFMMMDEAEMKKED
jgi:thioredoxin-related protein